MNPIDIVLAMLPQLSPSERAEVAKQLALSPCASQGHDYRKVGEVQENWMAPKHIVSICKRCGHEIRSS